MSQAQDNELRIPIEHVIPDSIETRFADRIVVQHAEHEFHISFFQIERPIVFGTPDETRQRLFDMGSLKAVCVARIVVAAGRMPDMVRALQENLEHYRASSDTSGEE